MKQLKNYFILFSLLFMYSNSYAVCNVQVNDFNFGFFNIQNNQEQSLTNLLTINCTPDEIGKPMNISFSKTTIEQNSNTINFELFIDGNQLIANEVFNFIISSEENYFALNLKISNINNTNNFPTGLFSSNIGLTYSY